MPAQENSCAYVLDALRHIGVRGDYEASHHEDRRRPAQAVEGAGGEDGEADVAVGTNRHRAVSEAERTRRRIMNKLFVIVTALSLTACAQPGQNRYGWQDVGHATEVEFGRVVAMRA